MEHKTGKIYGMCKRTPRHMWCCMVAFLLHVVLHGNVTGASLCAHLGLLFVVVVWVGVTCFTGGYFVYFAQYLVHLLRAGFKGRNQSAKL